MYRIADVADVIETYKIWSQQRLITRWVCLGLFSAYPFASFCYWS